MYLKEIQEKLLKELSQMVTDITGVEEKKLNPDDDINKFGFDSVTLTDFGNQMNNRYGIEVTPALFFEFNTLNSIASHLAETYSSQLSSYFHISGEDAAEQEDNEQTEEVFESFENSDGEEEEVTAEFFDLDDQEVEALSNEQPSFQQPCYDDIAIIGAAGIFPGADNIEEYWSVLEGMKNCVTQIPKTRFNWEDYYREQASLEGNDIITKYGGFIKDIDCFDAEFMGISPKEAELMDPQQRKLLEVVWHTLEDAGYNPECLQDTDTGVFIGVEGVDYTLLGSANGVVNESHPYSSTGIGTSLIANRISYVFNLHGPSEVISTACSSSLTTVDAAVKAIRNGDCEMALAGGVSAILTPYFYTLLSKLGVLSPDGECRTFDKDANGYVRGEGAGTILLKPLKKAQQDHDNIYAVIKGVALNHGGKANSITSPNVNMEKKLLETAYKRAGITPDTVTYIEAHGTGTKIGDHIEVDAIGRAFASLSEYYGVTKTKEHYCGLGSVKTNIGHLEPAASVASIIKVILSMKNGVLPGTVHFKELNPYIQLKNSPFYIVENTKKWERLIDENGKEIPRRAGISGFGYGGAYGHVVLEEYVRHIPEQTAKEKQILILSARDEECLYNNIRNLAEFLKKNADELRFHDVIYTLQTGRKVFDARAAIIASDFAEAIEKLEKLAAQEEVEGTYLCMDSSEHSELNSILTGKPGDAFRESLIQEGNVEKIAELWAEGLNIDWIHVPRKDICYKVSLPGYCFRKKKFWKDTGVVSWQEAETTNVLEGREGKAEQAQPAKAEAKPDVQEDPQSDIDPFVKQIQEYLVKTIQNLLKLDEDIDVTEDFADLGLDSITLNALLVHFQDKLDIVISPLVLLEYSSLEALSEKLAEDYRSEFTSVFGQSN